MIDIASNAAPVLPFTVVLAFFPELAARSTR
jgi:hypothetical protein